ncbi:hypothetical protein [Mycobacterium sp. 1165178.9]|nr:hypothetical protein [Mycobacterium sp. 1165178.9]
MGAVQWPLRFFAHRGAGGAVLAYFQAHTAGRRRAVQRGYQM